MRYNSKDSHPDREWILTNNLGGYALGFGNMINKRKYNGLLIASSAGLKRTHILSGIEERAECIGSSFHLDSTHYLDCIYPDGYNRIVRSWLRPYPCALYSPESANEEYVIFKEMFMAKGSNTVVVKYSNFGKSDLNLTLRPKFTLRDHHFLNNAGAWDREGIEKEIGEKSFSVTRRSNGVKAYGYITSGSLIDDQVIFRGVYYPVEVGRGYDSVEDLISPVRIFVLLPVKKSVFVLFSTEPVGSPEEEAKKIESYYKNFPLPSGHPEKPDTKFEMSDYRKTLELAAGDFIVGKKDEEDIVAGYPWFGAWGRDTLISLGALKYLPGGPQTAVRILRRYGRSISGGMLPNTFGEGGVGTNYDSVDAPLWYVLMCYKLGQNDKELFSNACGIISNFLNAGNLPFFVDGDGLIEIRPGNHALTWMDAKVYDEPVTPRHGKPVEINALWYNALCAVIAMVKNQKADTLVEEKYSLLLSQIEELSLKVKESLKKFVGDNYLADRIENGNPVWEIRPNAVIALSLPFDFTDKEILRRVWKTAKEKLLTPYGLRSLDPSHPAFKQKYIGNPKLRDLAYHQGTVWAFLLLPFASLAWKVLNGSGSQLETQREITSYIWTLRNDILTGESASVAEIWDSIDPSSPKGCPAQAWSVFSLLEIECRLSEKGGMSA